MVGRRRRTSDSTIGSPDSDNRAFVNELTVLKKHDPSLDAHEETALLQTFVLEDATVYDKTGRLVELFAVNTQGPFIVRGPVTIDESQKSRAVNPTTTTALIETRVCTRYAIGFSDNGYGAWAWGQAGWYEIRPPSAAYKPIFDRTIEGVSIYYIILGIIEDYIEEQKVKRRKKGQKKNVNIHKLMNIETLFLKYAVIVGDGSTFDEVVKRCDDHAHFLLSHIYEDVDVDWSPTVFFSWMTQRHPDIHAKVLELRNKKATGVKSDAPLSGGSDSMALPVAWDEPPTQKALSKRAQRNKLSERNATPQESNSHGIASHQQDTVKSTSKGKAKVQALGFPSAVEPATETMDADDVPDVLLQTELVETVHDRSNVETLLEGIEEIKAEVNSLKTAGFPKIAAKLYYKYKIKLYLGAGEILKYYAKELVQHLNEDEWDGSGFWKTLTEHAQGPRFTLEHIELEQIPSCLIRRKTTATTAARISGKSQDDKGAVVATPPSRSTSRPAGKMSSLRLAGTGVKRHLDFEESPEAVLPKAAKISHDHASEDEAMNDPSNSDDNDSPVRSTGSPRPAIKVVVRAENIPTTIPKGPNGTWVCDQNDCNFIERDPESDDGRDRIHEHMQDIHYQENENQVERISLAVTEGGKNHLPVDYLLEKIRQMGQRMQMNEEVTIGGVPVPQPIKRRLIS